MTRYLVCLDLSCLTLRCVLPCMRVPRPTIDAYYPVRHIAPFFIRLEFTLAKDGFVASSGE